MTYLTTCMLIILVASIISPLSGYTGSLYRCADSEGVMIYTDSPTQLQRCEPVTFNQPHNVANPVAIDQTASHSDPAIPPPPMSPHPDGSLSQMAPVGQGTLAAPSPTHTPCPIGINPLNPLSAPPCQPDK